VLRRRCWARSRAAAPTSRWTACSRRCPAGSPCALRCPLRQRRPPHSLPEGRARGLCAGALMTGSVLGKVHLVRQTGRTQAGGAQEPWSSGGMGLERRGGGRGVHACWSVSGCMPRVLYANSISCVGRVGRQDRDRGAAAWTATAPRILSLCQAMRIGVCRSENTQATGAMWPNPKLQEARGSGARRGRVRTGLLFRCCGHAPRMFCAARRSCARV